MDLYTLIPVTNGGKQTTISKRIEALVDNSITPLHASCKN
jgi:hypothetical protein